jgi:hypothetical protein
VLHGAEDREAAGQVADRHIDAADQRAQGRAELGDDRLGVADDLQFLVDPRGLEGGLVLGQLVALAAILDGGEAASAASMPVFMALWLPLMRGTFTKPAEQPIKAPPGKNSLGIDCRPPSVMARAP